jgi:hypothetical protein
MFYQQIVLQTVVPVKLLCVQTQSVLSQAALLAKLRTVMVIAPQQLGLVMVIAMMVHTPGHNQMALQNLSTLIAMSLIAIMVTVYAVTQYQLVAV